MYEHLKSLEPCGVPLLGSLKLLNTDQVAAINQAHPDVPPEYLSFLLEIGWGEWKDEIVACLGNPDPVDMKVYCPTGKETFDDEKTEEAPTRGDRCEAA